MPQPAPSPAIPLPRQWTQHIKSAVLHVISLAMFSDRTSAGQALEAQTRHPLEIQLERLEKQVRTLTEQLRIKDQRMSRIAAHRRPVYSPEERFEILQLKAAQNWSMRETAKQFLLAPATIASWLKRVDEGGADALLKISEPVNKFPDLVRHSVSRLKTLCPSLGKVKIAEILCRAGLHLSASTVGRMLKQSTPKDRGSSSIDDASETATETSDKSTSGVAPAKPDRIVTARYPNHVWHVDMTVVPSGAGFWTTWIPFTLPQCWPFCWWVVIVLDHFSRKAIGFAVLKKQPTALQVRTFLGRTIRSADAAPKYLISDKGSQFWNTGYQTWCKRKKIKPRFGAIGQHGSIAIIERFNRTFKELLSWLILIPLRQQDFRDECLAIFDWYNSHRPHMSLDGKTPNEVYCGIKFPAHRGPRLEPRANYPRGSPCAGPQTLVAGQPGDRFTLDIQYYRNRKHLPIIKLTRAA